MSMLSGTGLSDWVEQGGLPGRRSPTVMACFMPAAREYFFKSCSSMSAPRQALPDAPWSAAADWGASRARPPPLRCPTFSRCFCVEHLKATVGSSSLRYFSQASAASLGTRSAKGMSGIRHCLRRLHLFLTQAACIP